jgi:hypothetical protein
VIGVPGPDASARLSRLTPAIPTDGSPSAAPATAERLVLEGALADANASRLTQSIPIPRS